MFEAWIDEDCSTEHEDNGQKLPVQWALHNIAAPEDIQKLCVSEMLSRPNKVSSKSVEICWPVIERTMLCLCEGRLIFDELAATSSVVGIRSCTLTGATREIPEDLRNPKSRPSPLTLTLEITKGHHSWLEFLGRLRNDVARGTIELEVVNNTDPLRYPVLLRPDRQPKLPCPPKVLCLEVLV
jgi:hypothetical protein